MKTFLFSVPRGCVYTQQKPASRKYIFSRLKMRLIKIFFISAGAILQLLVFGMIVALSALCNS